MRWVFCSRAGGKFKGRCVTPVRVATLCQCLLSRRFRAWKHPPYPDRWVLALPCLREDPRKALEQLGQSSQSLAVAKSLGLPIITGPTFGYCCSAQAGAGRPPGSTAHFGRPLAKSSSVRQNRKRLFQSGTSGLGSTPPSCQHANQQSHYDGAAGNIFEARMSRICENQGALFTYGVG